MRTKDREADFGSAHALPRLPVTGSKENGQFHR